MFNDWAFIHWLKHLAQREWTMSRTMHIGSWYDTGVPLEGRGDGSTGYGTCARGWITMGPVAPGILMGRPSLGEAGTGTVPTMGG